MSTQFTVDIYQNEYLPEGGTEVNAIVTVTATGGFPAGGGPSAAAAEVIIIDTSGSMGYPASKMTAAKQATAAAIDTLRDGVAFAIIAGSHRAELVYPADGRLIAASAQTRTAAKAAVARVKPDGGTAIGSWLRLAHRLFTDHSVPGAIHHTILLTDGNNQHESDLQLREALAECAGSFTCDARGVGTDWVVAELRTVASALLGTVDIVADPAGLAADFQAMTEHAMGKAVAGVALRVWSPQGSSVRFVKQVLPAVEDLTGRRAQSGPLSGDYPLGAWGAESRDYHVCVEVRPGGVGDEMLGARVSLVLPGGEVAAQGLVRAVWTGDGALSTRINAQVAHYTGQAELAQAIQDGLEARRDGDTDTATTRLGRAVQLAAASGNTAIGELLGKVVEVEDPATGTVRLKATVNEADEMTLDSRSSKTVRVGKTGH